MVDRMDKQTRARVTAAGGHGRAAALTAEQRAAISSAGARAAHTPAARARQIRKAWPSLSDAERVEVLAILRPLKRHRPKAA